MYWNHFDLVKCLLVLFLKGMYKYQNWQFGKLSFLFFLPTRNLFSQFISDGKTILLLRDYLHFFRLSRCILALCLQIDLRWPVFSTRFASIWWQRVKTLITKLYEKCRSTSMVAKSSEWSNLFWISKWVPHMVLLASTNMVEGYLLRTPTPNTRPPPRKHQHAEPKSQLL